MRRRTFQQLKDAAGARHHHHVYVVLLDPSAAKDPALRRANPRRNPSMPVVYVGMTGLAPEERLANHLAGLKSSRWVRRFGVKLLPDLYEHLNPMPYDAAVRMEVELAEDLRLQGYGVAGGH